MELVLYHGSPTRVEQPLFGVGSPHNDFGLGFYCTQDAQLAAEWACKRQTDGYVNAYTFETEGLRHLDLMNGDYSVLHWIALLLANRLFTPRNDLARQVRAYLLEHFLMDTAPYDYITGYRADDSYFSYAQDFIDGALSVEKLSQALYLGKLGTQTVISSQRGFDALCFSGATFADAATHSKRFAQRDAAAREAYAQMKMGPADITKDLYALDLIRQEVDPHDPRIPRMLPC